jgi:hypothetical protein
VARKYKIGSGFHITTPIAAVILLLILFVSVGYFVVETIPALPPDNSEVLGRLEAGRSLWARERPAAFRYVVERDCSCADEIRRPYIVTEQSGQRRAEYPIPVESTSGVQLREPTDPVWLDDVFDRIVEADAESLAVTARFDSSFGFPSRAVIRRGGEAEEIVEEYEIRDFEVLYHR